MFFGLTEIVLAGCKIAFPSAFTLGRKVRTKWVKRTIRVVGGRTVYMIGEARSSRSIMFWQSGALKNDARWRVPRGRKGPL